MSKATWDEVEVNEKEDKDLSSEMVENPELENQNEEKQEQSSEEEGEQDGDQESNKDEEVEKIKYKLAAYEKLRRQNYAQAEQMRKLMLERNSFQSKLIQQYEDNLNHNRENLENKLHMAKAKLELAVEEGNSNVIAETNTEIAALAGEIRDISKAREQWDFQKKRNEEEARFNQERIKTRNEQNLNWFYSNPEFNPENSKYDKKLQREFINYAKEIDEELVNQGKAHVIGSPEYYEYFENIMDSYRNKIQNEPSGSLSINKRKGETFNPVSPVSRGSNGGAASTLRKSKDAIYISPEEARINKLWGITPEEHVKYTREWKDKDFEMEY